MIRRRSTAGALEALARPAAWALEALAPRRIHWRAVEHGGRPVERADGLVLQHEVGRCVWATRGYTVYRSDDGGPFERVVAVRPPVGEAWGGYLRVLRRRYGYQELVELLPLREDLLLAFAGGVVHRIDLARGSCERTHRLRFFGRGRGRGVMAFGLAVDRDGCVYYGEYSIVAEPVSSRVWRSDDEGRTWVVAHEFPPGRVRHVHAVQCDPYDGTLSVCTGDRDDESRVGVSHDRGETFAWVGSGGQEYRACSLLFLEDAVLWGMDADYVQNRLVRRQRAGGVVTAGTELPDATYYAQALDGETGLLGLAQGVAEVWVAEAGGSARRWLSWDLPDEPPWHGTAPGVRLARGVPGSGRYVHVGPLRTLRDESAVYRIPRSALPGAGPDGG